MAFVFEALLAEATKAALASDKLRRTKVVAILKEFFSEKTSLSEELRLYRVLYESKCKDLTFASRLLSEAKLEHRRIISRAQIKKQQTRLAKTINEQLSPEVFNNFVPNYKTLATIYQIFNCNHGVKERAVLEETLVGEMCQLPMKKERKEHIDALTYRIFEKRFEEKYANLLNEAQKKTLSYYIMSFSDDSLTLNSFLNEEIHRLRTEILVSEEINADEQMKEMAGEVLMTLEEISGQKINEQRLQKILEVQGLVAEISGE